MKKSFILFILIIFISIINAESYKYIPENGKMYCVIKDDFGNVISKNVAELIYTESGQLEYGVKNPNTGKYENISKSNYTENKKVSYVIIDSDKKVEYRPLLRNIDVNDPNVIQIDKIIQNDPAIQKSLQLTDIAKQIRIDEIKNSIDFKDPTKKNYVNWLLENTKQPTYIEIDNRSERFAYGGQGFYLKNSENNNSEYMPKRNVGKIRLGTRDGYLDKHIKNGSIVSTIVHENAHNIMSELYGGMDKCPSGLSSVGHDTAVITDKALAYTEGWAAAAEDGLAAKLSPNFTKDNISKMSKVYKRRVNGSISNNNYIFQTDRDGYASFKKLKNAQQMLNTEGFVATQFSKLMRDKIVDDGTVKSMKVMVKTKPVSYMDFLNKYIKEYPNDSEKMIKSFLKDSKYTTVDSNATKRYSEYRRKVKDYVNAKKQNDSALIKKAKSELKVASSEYKSKNKALLNEVLSGGKLDKAVGDELWVCYKERGLMGSYSRPINLNTETNPTLLAQTLDVSNRMAEELIRKRDTKGSFKNLEDLRKHGIDIYRLNEVNEDTKKNGFSYADDNEFSKNVKNNTKVKSATKTFNSALKHNFSLQSIAFDAAMVVGTNLFSKIVNGETIEIKSSLKYLVSAEFGADVVGSAFGSAAGHVASLAIQTALPAPVGTILSAIMPVGGAILGGRIGVNSVMSFKSGNFNIKDVFKNIDYVETGVQAVGSVTGSMIGSVILPPVGTFVGGMVGGIIGKKVVSLLRNDKKDVLKDDLIQQNFNANKQIEKLKEYKLIETEMKSMYNKYLEAMKKKDYEKANLYIIEFRKLNDKLNRIAK